MKDSNSILLENKREGKFLLMAFFLCTAMLLFSCSDGSYLEREIEQIPIDLTIVRFDEAFAAATPNDLHKLKNEFPEFFPQQYHDSIWIGKLTDTLQFQLEQEVFKQFPNEETLEDILIPLFQHIKYYFPKFETPKVITATSEVDYKNRVILADSLLILALDTYLGSDHHFYEGIDRYIVKEMKPSQIGPDVAEAYAYNYIKPPSNATFLSQIIYYGKQLYLKDLWLPGTSDADKIGYTEEEYSWAEENELYMWRYFVENELLYSTDQKLGARFINPAPFSKFYLEIDNDSPGMLGRYLGWKIVKAYMENNTVEVQRLMITDAEEIFKNSKYKPKK